MIGFAVRGDLAVFHFDEITDMDIFRQFGARAQTRIRADYGCRADDCIVDMAERFDARIFADVCIDNHAVRANCDAVFQCHFAFENATDVDAHIASADQCAAHVDTVWIGQCHAALQ